MIALIELFLTEKRFAGKSPETLISYTFKLKKFQSCTPKRPQEISREDIAEFLHSRSCTDEGKGGYWRVIRAFFRWAVRHEYISHDPTLNYKPRFKAARIRPAMPKELIDDALAAINRKKFNGKRDFAIFSALYFTAARESEILNLRKDHIDLQARVISIHGKGNKVRSVPIVPRLGLVLIAYIGHVKGEYVFPATEKIDRPLGRCHASHLWLDYQRKAGIARPWRTHDLRHAAASLLYENGMDLSDIQHLLGHSTIQVTQRYARHSVKRLASEMDRFFK